MGRRRKFRIEGVGGLGLTAMRWYEVIKGPLARERGVTRGKGKKKRKDRSEQFETGRGRGYKKGGKWGEGAIFRGPNCQKLGGKLAS